MDTWLWIVIAVVVVLALAGLLLLWSRHRARSRGLQERFGREYDATVESSDKRRHAERELRAREAEHDALDLRPLSDGARERYSREWEHLQSRFVDHPRVAVAEADDLVTQVMRERGYPVDDFEAKSRLVSVDHPDLVQHYRSGHDVAEKARNESASTEELRRAVIDFRALFDELLQDGMAPTA